jgi:hypothetical protein
MPTYLGAASRSDFAEWDNDFKATQSETGRWTATWSLQCRAEKMRAKAPRPGASCTFPGFGFLKVTKVDGAATGGGLGKLVVSFEGFDFNASYDPAAEEPGVPEGAVYQLDLLTAEDPIETNPYYADVSAKDLRVIALIKRGDVTTDSNGNWQLKEEGGKTQTLVLDDPTGPAGKLALKILKGRETAYSPRQRWNVSYSSPAPLTGAQIAKLAKICNPPGGPPTPEGDYSWLFAGGTLKGPAAGPFEITLSFDLSGPGGWDEDEYA